MPTPVQTNAQVAPFDDADGVWLRCALHAHSTDSDGWLSPVALRRLHALAGYDVLAITDHDRWTPPPAGDDDLLLLGGTELSLTAPISGGPLHVLGIGIEDFPAVDLSATLAEATAAIHTSGGLAFVAHPVWSGLRTEEVGDLPGVAGIEIFNGSCEVEQGRAHAGAHWDVWLAAGLRLGGLATDDLHCPGFDSFHAWTMVRARTRTPDAVLAALRAGRYYATTGPRVLDLAVSEGCLTVRTTPAVSITALGAPPVGDRVQAGVHAMTFATQRVRHAVDQTAEGLYVGDLLTGASFTRDPRSPYVRIVVTDAGGRMAWTNPVWWDTPPVSG